MIDDFYQAALAALTHHLDEAQVPYTLDDGELLVDSHRIGLSIGFEDFVVQGEHTLAPLDVQIHLDGDDGDRFRVGTLGVGTDRATALREAIFEWHLLAAAPLLAALGAPLQKRRASSEPQRLAGWDLFPGRIGIRGAIPPELRSGSPFYRSLFEGLREVISRWDEPERFTLRSIYLMASRHDGIAEVQAAIDGLVNEDLVQVLSGLSWPAGGDPYLLKQLFVLRHPGRA
jgi:hypothetical protein